MAIVDPKWTISHFFAGRDISGDCGFKMNDFPFFSRTRNQWRLSIQNGRFPTFFPDAISVAIVDPKWTISYFFPGRDINGDCGFKTNDFPFFSRTRYQWRSRMQNGRFDFPSIRVAIVDPKSMGRFPTFFPDAILAIVDPKWMISLFFLGRDISGDCGSNKEDFPFFSRSDTSGDSGYKRGDLTQTQWRL